MGITIDTCFHKVNTKMDCFVGSRLLAMTPVIFPQLLNCHDDL
ncbi:hypothetical protein [Candidatus Tisiphia endosymbiont of Hybos culiciformis]